MAIDIPSAISEALILASNLVLDIQKAKAQAGANASLSVEAVDLIEIAVVDPAVQASLRALISAL